MKTSNIKLLLLTAGIYFTAPACTTEVDNPLLPGGGVSTPTSQVINSQWFGGTWGSTSITEVKQFVTTVPELTTDILSTGRVLIFAKGGFEMKSPTILPSNFDRNFIAANAQPGNIKFLAEGTGSISTTLQFRYILIPSAKVVTENKLNYSDYDAVCSYYGLPR